MNNEVKEALKYYNNKILFHEDFLNESFDKAEDIILDKVNKEYSNNDVAFIIVTDDINAGRKLCDHLVEKNQFCVAETYEAEKSNTLEVYCCKIDVKKYKVSTDLDFNQDEYRYIDFRPVNELDSDFYIFNENNENIDEDKVKGNPIFIATGDHVETPDVDLIIPKEHLDLYLRLLEKFASPRVVIKMHKDDFIKNARGRLVFSKRYEYSEDEECLAQIAADTIRNDLNGAVYVFSSEYNPMMLFKIGTAIVSRFPGIYINQCAVTKIYGNKKKYIEILVFR